MAVMGWEDYMEGMGLGVDWVRFPVYPKGDTVFAWREDFGTRNSEVTVKFRQVPFVFAVES